MSNATPHPLEDDSKILRKKLWFDAATWFATLSGDVAVHKLLERLGNLHRADRTWVVLLNAEKKTVQITHEWCAAGVSSALAKVKPVSVQTYRWIFKKIISCGEVGFSTLVIPKRFSDLKDRMIAQQVRAFYCIPIFIDKTLVGALGYHRVHDSEKWSRAEHHEMREATELIRRWIHSKIEKDSATPQPQPTIFIKDKRQSIATPISNLISIEAALNYSRLYLVDHAPITKYRSMEHWESQLPSNDFLRVHRSYIVNVKKITALKRNGGAWKITLTDNRMIPVGRQFRPKLLERLKET